MGNVITSPFFALAMRATRGATAKERATGIAGLIELHASTPCKWTAATVAEHLLGGHGVRLRWNDDTASFDVVVESFPRRKRAAKVIPLGPFREARGDARRGPALAPRASKIPPAA